MDLEAFDYDLPDTAIARTPAEPRDSARLAVVGRGRGIEHRTVADVAALVGPGDVIVLNDTKVRPARLKGTRTSGGSCEFLFLAPRGDGWWEALVRPSRKFAAGSVAEITLDGEREPVRVDIGDDLGEGRRLIRPLDDVETLLDRFGEMPLPPYLGDVTLPDPGRYQTVYADRVGSAAAPTAGLHVTTELLDRVSDAGATIERIELQVGLGTFRPITADEVEHHVMHSEVYRIDERAWEAIEAARRVVAVGTTSVRALESAALSGKLSGATDIFIRRPFAWQVVDVLMTNFHLPRSSLLVMIDAFVGDRWRAIYGDALAAGYRFLSFGDAMWLERNAPGGAG